MYTYTLANVDGEVAANPLGEWTIEYVRNPGQIFRRRILRGELTFVGADYDLIMAQAGCFPLEFVIYCDGEIYWVGEIKFPYSLYVDTDQCFVRCTPEVVDEYTCIMANYETEYEVTTAAALAGLGYFTTTPWLKACGGANIMSLVLMGRLWDHLENLITNLMDCSLNCYSSFFELDNFPNDDNYAASYNIDNYITGTAPYAGTNRLVFMFLTTNSGIRVRFGGTACDGTQYYSFKFFEEVLRNRFNAYWYIDQNGDFRVEHRHFFDADFAHSDFEDGIDLTTMAGRCLPTFASRKNKYEYLTEDLFDQEVWTWQHYDGTEGTVAHHLDFTGDPIYYGAAANTKSDCVPGEFKEKEWPTPTLWSDIYWAYLLIAAGEVDTIQCPGFCLLDIDTAPVTDIVNCETGLITGAAVINGHCSTANLMEHYFTYDRIFLTGTMNGSDASPVVAFETEIRKKLQTEIEFPLCCTTEFDPMDFIVTEMGSGALYSAIQSSFRDSLTVKLLY